MCIAMCITFAFKHHTTTTLMQSISKLVIPLLKPDYRKNTNKTILTNLTDIVELILAC